MTDTLDEREQNRARAKALRDEGMRCNCDLDNWQPEPLTGHSWVCRIHKRIMQERSERIMQEFREASQ